MEKDTNSPGSSSNCQNVENVEQDMIHGNSQEVPFSSGCSECLKLENRLKEEEKKCNVLRANIHKVSANWFHRKSQISESEMEHETSPVNLLDETTPVDDKNNDNGSSKEGSQSGLSKDVSKLVNIIAQKSAQLDLADTHCRDLKKKMREYEQIIDDKESIIHGLKDQLETYLTDNQKMSSQLNHLASLFQQLEKVDKESVVPPEIPIADAESPTAVPLPNQEEYHEMASSVSRTYIKLKDLIYEKKALVTEIERLNTLNVELQRRVLTQENRLMSVSDALHQTWLVVSNLKDQHAKLHEDEMVYKYELKEKREILTKLRKELELSREKWQIIRQKNLESEKEYASIREMLRERRQAANEGEPIPEAPKEEEEPDEAVCMHPDDASFDPPVDLLLEMGLEYGIIGEGAEMTQTVLQVIGGEDIRTNRLEQLEEHCSLLYSKLIQSTSRSLSLASRLTRLHSHFGSSDDEDEDDLVEMEEDDDDDEEEEGEEHDEEEDSPYITDANHMAVIESNLSSPESEEYDTAYVSETDAENQIENFITTATINLPTVGEASTSYAPDVNTNTIPEDEELGENCDQLSRTLINFLPKKIEYLKEQNDHLESNITSLKEERTSAQEIAKKFEKDNLKLQEEMKILTKEMTFEKLQKRQLEEQLKHLGKCVDELKLKHDDEKNPPKSEGTGDDETEDTTTENRSEDEKRKETDKLKREVELVKKEMELKRKEKDLRKREQELDKKETERPASNVQMDTDNDTNIEKIPLVSPSEFSCIPSIVDLREVISNLVHPKNESTTENLTSAEISSAVTTSDTSNPDVNQRLQKYNVMPLQEIEFIEIGKKTTTLVVEDGVFVIPIRLKKENEQVICSIWPSKDASLLVLQVTTPKIEEDSTTVDHQPSTSSSSSESLISTVNSSNNFNCTILVPASQLPPNVESSVTLKAKCPIMCIVVVRQIKKEDLEVVYSISTQDEK